MPRPAWDLLDACDIDLSLIDPVPDEHLPYLALSPDEDHELIEAYGRLFLVAPGPPPTPYSLGGRQLWIADKCREWGLEVVEVDGWRTRGGGTFNPRGVVCHHTAGPSSGDMPTLRILINGRSDLPGPLCNVGLSRSGKIYVIASGRANHAGSGGWNGLEGNSSVLGIEAENDGRQPWPSQQLEAYHTLCAAFMEGISQEQSIWVCGHKEWAPQRKVDPHTLNMKLFRLDVQDEFDKIPVEEDELRGYVFFKREDYGAVFLTTDDFKTFDGVRTVKDWQALADAGEKSGARVAGRTGDTLVVITPGQFTEFDDQNVRTATIRQTIRSERAGGTQMKEWWQDLPELV